LRIASFTPPPAPAAPVAEPPWLEEFCLIVAAPADAVIKDIRRAIQCCGRATKS
jgi:hypothetical protein